jgi:DNA-binding MarR family transcriptional regulator
LLLKKLVAKKPNRADKRLVDITITEAGLSQLQQLDERNNETDAIVSNLSKEEAVQLSSLLDKIRGTNGHHIE